MAFDYTINFGSNIEELAKEIQGRLSELDEGVKLKVKCDDRELKNLLKSFAYVDKAAAEKIDIKMDGSDAFKTLTQLRKDTQTTVDSMQKELDELNIKNFDEKINKNKKTLANRQSIQNTFKTGKSANEYFHRVIDNLNNKNLEKDSDEYLDEATRIIKYINGVTRTKRYKLDDSVLKFKGENIKEVLDAYKMKDQGEGYIIDYSNEISQLTAQIDALEKQKTRMEYLKNELAEYESLGIKAGGNFGADDYNPGSGDGSESGEAIADAEKLEQILTEIKQLLGTIGEGSDLKDVVTCINSISTSLEQMRAVISDVGGGQTLSPLLSQISELKDEISIGSIGGESELKTLTDDITQIREALVGVKGVLVDVGDSKEFSPLLEMINSVVSAVEKLAQVANTYDPVKNETAYEEVVQNETSTNSAIDSKVEQLNKEKEAIEKVTEAEKKRNSIASTDVQPDTSAQEQYEREEKAINEVIEAEQRLESEQKQDTSDTSEISEMELLEQKVLAVTEAVDRKTQAFQEEDQTVSGVVQREISDLEVLDGQLLTIIETIERLNTTQITLGLDTINNKSESGIIKILTELQEKINSLDFTSLSEFSNAMKGLKITDKTSENLDKVCESIEKLKGSFSGMSGEQNEFLSLINSIVSQKEPLQNLAKILESSVRKIQKVKEKIEEPDKSDTSKENKTPVTIDQYETLKDKLSTSSLSDGSVFENFKYKNGKGTITYIKELDDEVVTTTVHIEDFTDAMGRIEQVDNDLVFKTNELKTDYSSKKKKVTEESDESNDFDEKIVKKTKKQITSLKTSFTQAFKGDDFGAQKFLTTINEVVQNYNEIKQLHELDLISDEELFDLQAYMDKLQSVIEMSTLNKVDPETLMPGTKSEYESLKTSLNDISTIMEKIKTGDFNSEDKTVLEDLIKDAQDLNGELGKAENILANSISVDKLRTKIAQTLSENTKHNPLMNSFRAQLKELQSSLVDGMDSKTLKAKTEEYFSIFAEIEQRSVGGLSVFSRIGGKIRDISNSFIAQYLSIQDIIRYVREGLTTITELDTAFTEMRKVSNESIQTLRSFQQESFEIASAVGTTAQQIQNSTADWMKEILVPLYGNI